MIAHILPCALEAELLAVLAYLAAHARDVLALVVGWLGRNR